MKGVIQNFRRGLGAHAPNHVVINVPAIKTKAQGLALMGKKAVFKTLSGKFINGKITSVHGTNGNLMARFDRGLPGQAIGMTVEIK